MTKKQQLVDEATRAAELLHNAAETLSTWAASLDSDYFTSPLSGKTIRESAAILAYQSGRLAMAIELATKK